MRSPAQLVSLWWKRHQMRDQIATVSVQLASALGNSIRLQVVPHSGGGADAIFLVHRAIDFDRRRRCDPVAVVRVASTDGDFVPDEPELPRIALLTKQRIEREAAAYQMLAPLGRSPELLIRGDDFLANTWLPGTRASAILRRSEEAIWDLLPLVLTAIRAMHAQDVVHMDLNCGNLLVSPDQTAVAFIDFEYAPASQLSPHSQRAFDYLRFAHNLLKPRRGLNAILKQPDRFVRCFADAVDRCDCQPDELPSACMNRLDRHNVIREGFEHLFGFPASAGPRAAGRQRLSIPERTVHPESRAAS